MDNPPDNPFTNLPALVGSGETHSSTSSEPPRRRTIPRRIANLIGKVGLRYEPSVKSDLEAHAARVALLAEDMADADPGRLEQAIGKWVAVKPYLPKASDLNEIMADFAKPAGPKQYVDVVGNRNAQLAAEGSDLRWAWNNPDDRGAGTHLYSLAESKPNPDFFA